MTGTADIIVRTEMADDHAMVRDVNLRAFGGPAEADLVDHLRRNGVVLLSAVAALNRHVVGHILFSRMTIDTPAGVVAAAALAPLAVAPEHQRQGIGGRLIVYGLDTLRSFGERIVIVLGHPDYYPRFGFSPALAANLSSPFPPEAYMALELVPGALDGIRGQVRYPPAFGV
jgi:putative acetyltransferase